MLPLFFMLPLFLCSPFVFEYMHALEYMCLKIGLKRKIHSSNSSSPFEFMRKKKN
ncbi:hypothetical protein Lalb_Chr15g0081401 [Lupinus albus]|uniref:Uncharacterized protein n=1 Tax=Lupinus albus TaxID=3870 RepID=A0A6A4NY33_LUPAL|nr:hypothetical protein Lalb_Chr15g0081401 [Lupinus albus]